MMMDDDWGGGGTRDLRSKCKNHYRVGPIVHLLITNEIGTEAKFYLSDIV